MVFSIFKKQPVPAPADIHGVPVRVSLRARRLSLTMDMKRGEIVLVYPKRASRARAEKFVRDNMRWIEAQRQKHVAPRAFADGDRLTIHGHEYKIRHRPGRGIVHIDGSDIIVPGAAAHMHRRLRDFLKKEAARVLKDLSDDKAAALGLKPAPVRVIDPKTRWGSCTHDGRLMYSWRLILAPPVVLDYLVAHEVAHRVHMNHGKSFWRLCADIAADAPFARRWLDDHGKELMAWR